MNSQQDFNTFRIIPWDDDFMLRVYELAHEITGGKHGKAIIVFPLNRPRRYLLDIYKKKAQGPVLMPNIIHVRQLIELCLESWTRYVPRMADTLDQVAVLKDCLLELGMAEDKESPLAKLALPLKQEGDMAHFFPWGVRLARLLDECALHMVKAEDLLHVDDIVAPYAATLLNNLGRIQESWRTLLRKRNMSTLGLEEQHAAQLAEACPELPMRLRGKKIILAGFVRLTHAENRLFRYLWEHGATVCLHTDPDIASGGGHWSCSDHKEWISRWKARGEIFGKSTNNEPRIHFYAGYDLHSQLNALNKELSAKPCKDEMRAVVLSHDSLLMPTLHHIPEKSINISLGYPLKRSLLAQLVERLLNTRLSMDEDGRVHWKSLMALIRHPYVRMLAAEGKEGTMFYLRPFLTRMEGVLRRGSRMVEAFTCASDLVDDILGDLENNPLSAGLSEENGRLLEKAVRVMVEDWRHVATLEDTANCLRGLCELLLENGRHIWPRFPLDGECLARLIQNVIPALADNAMAKERLSLESLIAIVQGSLAEQRVPFEADPLTGLQILGTLETRLLHFDRVYMLDLTEDALPGAPARDPLLPDSLRPLLGLPDTNRRDILAAHTFHRLIAGAKEVFLYWQEGVQSGVMDGKKIRSRLVEECIWRVEQRMGHILRPGEEPLIAAVFPMAEPPTPKDAPIVRTSAIDERMREIMSRNISPTALDAYLSCPAFFFYKYACHMKEPEEVLEGDDHLGVGILLHSVLLKAFQPFLGKAERPHIQAEQLEQLFYEELAASNLSQNLPAPSRFMLEAAGPSRLRVFAAHQPEVLEVLALEQKLSAAIEDGERHFCLEGKIDRLDNRASGMVVLDYKSGSTVRQPHPSFWENETLWIAMEHWRAGQDDPLLELSQVLPSVQLPVYVYLCMHDLALADGLRRTDVWDAALVQLAQGGEEIPLFGDSMESAARSRIMQEKIPALLRFLLRHMATAREFPKHSTDLCASCQYKSCCG